MLVTHIFKNLRDFEIGSRELDLVEISADDSLKKILRVTSQSGRDIGINLQSGHLHDGDILYFDDKIVIAIEFLPQDVLVISPANIDQMGFLAHYLGNRHMPANFENGTIITHFDELTVGYLSEFCIKFERLSLKIKKPLKHASHSH